MSAVEQLLRRLDHVRKNGVGWTACCPAHDDRHASLSVGVGDDGRVLLRCHAGCSFEAIVAAVNLRTSDLFEPNPTTVAARADRPRFGGDDATLRGLSAALLGNPAALVRLEELRGWLWPAITHAGVGIDGDRIVFPYRTAAGELVGAARYQPDPARRNGGPKLKADAGSRRELFPEPERMPTGDGWLFVVEGEPDALRAFSCGIPAIAVPGVQGWRKPWADRFAGRRVCVVFDCDSPGREAAQRVAGDLAGVADDVRVLDLDTARQDGYDLSDFTASAKAADERDAVRRILLDSAERAPRVEPPQAEDGATNESYFEGEPTASDEQTVRQRLTLDARTSVVAPPTNPLGVARQFVTANYDDERASTIRHHRGLFFTWAVTHWIEVEQRAVRAQLYQWLGDAVYEHPKEGLVPFDPTRTKVGNVLEALEADVHLPDRLEPPTWIGEAPFAADGVVSVQNGLLRLESRELHPHTPRFFNSHTLPFGYDPDAPAPARWLRFLHELWGDDQESVDTLAEVMGYVLGGGTAQQKIVMLVGPKRTGKGTILRVLTALLGQENVAAPTLSSLSTNFGLQPLVGKPLAAISDARLGTRSDALVAVERLLSISGEDSITIDRKYKDPWTGKLPTRFVLLTNEIPRFTDASGALASRFVILTLTNSFYGREDPALTGTLLEEASGIFNWALAGLDRLSDRGRFLQPQAAASALRHLEDLASPVSAFVRDRCTVGPQRTADKDELWKAWKTWVDDEGGDPGTKAVFVRDLRAAVPGATPRRLREGGIRRNVIAGLALGVEETEDQPETAPNPAQNAGGQGWSGVEPIVGPLSEIDEEELERLYALGEEQGLTT